MFIASLAVLPEFLIPPLLCYASITGGFRVPQMPSLAPSLTTLLITLVRNAYAIGLHPAEARKIMAKAKQSPQMYDYILQPLNVLGLAYSVFLLRRHGDFSFTKYKLRGPFRKTVAHATFHAQKTECAVSVYFPTDVGEVYHRPKSPWLNYDMKYIRHYLDMRKWYKNQDKADSEYYQYPARSLTTLAYEKSGERNLRLCKKLKSSKIVPIVFSHGLTGSRAAYSAQFTELAAHGYMVFALDHHDGSCPYTEDSTGSTFWKYDAKAPPLIPGE